MPRTDAGYSGLLPRRRGFAVLCMFVMTRSRRMEIIFRRLNCCSRSKLRSALQAAVPSLRPCPRALAWRPELSPASNA